MLTYYSNLDNITIYQKLSNASKEALQLNLIAILAPTPFMLITRGEEGERLSTYKLT
jgi:hypothetical protein